MKVTYRCDQCEASTDKADPFTPVPSRREEHHMAPHWLRAEGGDFCSPTCATAFWADPLKDSILAAHEWLRKATEQLDHKPDAPAGDMRGVQMPAKAIGFIQEAIRILRDAVAKTGSKAPAPDDSIPDGDSVFLRKVAKMLDDYGTIADEPTKARLEEIISKRFLSVTDTCSHGCSPATCTVRGCRNYAS